MFYIGDGRDIEIAVPSTKTFTAHLLLGFIFTLYIKEKIERKKANKDLVDNPKCLLILKKNEKISRNDRCEATGKKFKNCCGAL